PVHLAHDPREHGAVAHAGVEQAHRRRTRMDVAELEAHAPRDHVLLAAGIDEQQVLLAVVEEAEILLRRELARRRRGRLCAGADERQQLRRRIARTRQAVLRDELVDPGQGLRGDARAVAQARDELAVVDGAASERRFGHAGAPAEVRDASEQCAAAAFQGASFDWDVGEAARGTATPAAAAQYYGMHPTTVNQLLNTRNRAETAAPAGALT